MKIPVQFCSNTMEENSPSQNLNHYKNQGGGTIPGPKPSDDGNPKLQYSIPGILHFIQHEWSRFETERTQWETEKAELQARIAFLQGERKGQENLKNDLVRRIKMLEYALKQERAKYHQLRYGSEIPQGELRSGVFDEGAPDVAPDGDAPFSSVSNITWKQGRQMLRQYLQEIGYTDAILDVRSNRVRCLLGLNNNDEGGNVNGDGGTKRPTEAQGGRRTPGARPLSSLAEAMVVDTQDSVMANFEFLAGRLAPTVDMDDDDMDDIDDDGMDATAIETNQNTTRRHRTKLTMYSEGDDLDAEAEEMLNELNLITQNEGSNNMNAGREVIIDEDCNWAGVGTGTVKKECAQDPIDSSLGLGELAQLTVNNDADSTYDEGTSKEALRKVWNIKYSLRSHFDCVRAMAFHPQEPVLITGSDDHTLKLWNLQKTVPAKKSASLDVEPLYTFRGHRGPVLSICMSPSGEQCYSAADNGLIYGWNVPSFNIDPYDSYESRVLGCVLKGHTDAVWRVVCHPQRPHLLSCSADGSLKLWSITKQSKLLQTFISEQDGVPTSVDFTYDDSDKMVASFASGHCVLFDLETGKAVTRLEAPVDSGEWKQDGHIYRVACHPLMGISVTAHENRHICFHDNGSGKLIHSMVAHLDAVTSLAIDPNALYLLSGSHDCSIRLWSLENKTCVQEITAHRKKFDESILDVAFHPTKPFIASAGADALAKVFV